MRESKAARAPHVLIIVENLPVPLDRRVWLECQALVARGYRVSVICPKGPGDPAHQHLDGVDIHKYAPPREAGARAPAPRLLRNLASVEKGGNACSLAAGGAPAPVIELIDDDDADHSSVVFDAWPVLVELELPKPARVNTVALKGGNLSWKNQCAPEDVEVEGLLADGAWRTLASVRDAATRNRHDNAEPLVLRFGAVTVAKLRVKVTRGSDAGKRFLVLREVEAFLEE